MKRNGARTSALFISLPALAGGNDGRSRRRNKVLPLFLPGEYAASLERRPNVWEWRRTKTLKEESRRKRGGMKGANESGRGGWLRGKGGEGTGGGKEEAVKEEAVKEEAAKEEGEEQGRRIRSRGASCARVRHCEDDAYESSARF